MVKYAVLVEVDHKEEESYYCFLQYEGNENELKKLMCAMDNVCFENLGDVSSYSLDIENLVSEQTAKEIQKLDVTNYMSAQIMNGTFKLPFDVDDIRDNSNDDNIWKFDEYFYKSGIKKYFT